MNDRKFLEFPHCGMASMHCNFYLSLTAFRLVLIFHFVLGPIIHTPSQIQQPQILAKPTKPEVTPVNPASNGHASENGEASTVIEKEPEIRVTTILKRPASTPSNLALNGQDENGSNGDLDPITNLRKREEEYEKMRLRILGSTTDQQQSNESATPAENS